MKSPDRTPLAIDPNLSSGERQKKRVQILKGLNPEERERAIQAEYLKSINQALPCAERKR